MQEDLKSNEIIVSEKNIIENPNSEDFKKQGDLSSAKVNENDLDALTKLSRKNFQTKKKLARELIEAGLSKDAILKILHF